MALTFLLVFGESALLLDLFVPGEVGLVVAGAAAAQNGTPLPWLVGAAALGALAGDTVGFTIGRRFGESLVDHWRWTRKRLRPGLTRARAHYERRGGASVAVARWVGALRAIVPFVAGSARLPTRTFLLWDVPSAVLWALTIASIGFVWGDDAASFVDRLGLLISAVALIIVGVVIWRVRRSSSSAPEASTS